MSRRRMGIGAELAPLVLILACLAGSLGLIVAAYRRVNLAKSAPGRPPAVVFAPVAVPKLAVVAPRPAQAFKPVVPVAVEAPPAPDPTPAALAQLAAAEAEQLLEASRANRQAQALDEARQAAVAESERWRRRQSLIHSQIDTLETKVRKAETELDAMAFERDALEKELDARKAAAARARTRPGQAILPHKGPNGTWRRPVVVECRNGAAVIQPQGAEFGLHELEAGFGPSSNRFVAAVAREAIRVQRQASPDGAPVVPYIFFLVRPDGIRPYYEARGRLEALGITFGYELADADWEIEFPNLDDVATWDGSAPADGSNPVLSRNLSRAGSANSAEDTDLPISPGARGGSAPRSSVDPNNPFTFGGSGPAPGGGGSRLPSLIGRSLGTAGSGFAGASGSGNGPGGGGGDGGGGSGGSLGTDPNKDSTSAGPVPAGFPAAFLAGGDGTKSEVEAGSAADALPGAAPGGSRPAGLAGTRITASGRVVPVAPGTGFGSPGSPTGKPGSAGNPPALTRGEVPGQPGGSPGSKQDQGGGNGGAADQPRGRASRTDAQRIELAMDGPTADSAGGSAPTNTGKPSERGGAPGMLAQHSTAGTGTAPAELTLDGPSIDQQPTAPTDAAERDATDPGSTFVWPTDSTGDGKKRPDAASPTDPTLPMTGAERATQATSPSGNPAAPGGGGSARPSGTRASGGGSQAAKLTVGQPSQASSTTESAANQPPPPPGAMGIGLNSPAMPTPPPANLPNLPLPTNLPNLPPPAWIPPIPPALLKLPIPRHLPTPAEAGAAVQRQTNAPPNLADFVPQGSIVDKTFEVVVVCGPEGVIVQPGNYRVTADALKDREGLFKKQVVALVKNRRLADPTMQLEPRIRFLIQPRGFETYQAARSQFFVSGLNWPTTIQVADPDPLVIRSRGDW